MKRAALSARSGELQGGSPEDHASIDDLACDRDHFC